MKESVAVDPSILRNVAAIPIICLLSKGPLFTGDVVKALRGVAAGQTVIDGLNRLMIGGYVHCETQRSHGSRRLFQLTEKGHELCTSSIADWRFPGPSEAQL